MKKLIPILLVLFMLSATTAFAQETEQSNTELPDPGTTPDSSMYFLDLAMEDLELALTFDTDAKVEKELEFASERLAEAKAMALEGDVEAMTKAVSKHDEIITKLKVEVEDMSDEDSEESELKVEYKTKIEGHDEKVNDFKQEIEIEIKGNLTPEQQEQVNDLINSIQSTLGEQSGKVEIEIEIETDDDESDDDKVEIEAEIETDDDKSDDDKSDDDKSDDDKSDDDVSDDDGSDDDQSDDD